MIQFTGKEVFDAMYAAFLESNKGERPQRENKYEDLDDGDKRDCELIAKHFNKRLEEKQCTPSNS